MAGDDERGPLDESFTGSAILAGGLEMLTEDHFDGPDAYAWTIAVKDSTGTTLSRMTGRERRVRG